MNIKNRLVKLEQSQESSSALALAIAIIIVHDGETKDEAYQRCFPDGSKKPKSVVYGTPIDVLI